uniref:CIA30 family protein n=1 Tax=Brugia timori TaxID=42155 RepID=A0A0R3R6Y8_9BILA
LRRPSLLSTVISSPELLGVKFTAIFPDTLFERPWEEAEQSVVESTDGRTSQVRLRISAERKTHTTRT